jgi:predicted transcriptional regulator
VTYQNTEPDFVVLTSEIIAAYVARNPVSTTDLPALITQVHKSLTVLATGVADEPPPQPQTPAVPIKRSYTDDAIACLECGLRFKMLKRHLSENHDMEPEHYRAKWQLPDSYPMTAPAYSQRRSELAKTHGLGRASASSADQVESRALGLDARPGQG